LIHKGYFMSQGIDEEKSKKVPNQWMEVIAQLFDRLTGKGGSAAYTFENLIIDIPRAAGPQGLDLGSVQWIINGRLVMTAGDTAGRRNEP
jgi:hypothetical protein